jgi:hypothetical protein
MIASLENIGQLPEQFAASTDLIAILRDSLVTVWNFMLDSVVTWDVSSDTITSSVCSEFYAFQDIVTSH